MPPPVPPVDNRTRILEAAETLFATNGFAATSVREIVQAAAVTAPTLYYHFGSKDELLVTLIRERFIAFHAALEERMAATATTEGLVRAWCDELLREALERPATMRFIYASLWGPQIRHAVSSILSFHVKLRTMFTDALQRVRPDVASDRAHYAFIMTSGLLDAHLHVILLGVADHVFTDLVDSVVTRVASMLDDGTPVPAQFVGCLRDYYADHECEGLPCGSATEDKQ